MIFQDRQECSSREDKSVRRGEDGEGGINGEYYEACFSFRFIVKKAYVKAIDVIANKMGLIMMLIQFIPSPIAMFLLSSAIGKKGTIAQLTGNKIDGYPANTFPNKTNNR